MTNQSRIVLVAVLALWLVGCMVWYNSTASDRKLRDMINGLADLSSANGVDKASGQHSHSIPLPNSQVLHTLTREQLAQIYHGYVNSVQMSCDDIIRYGLVTDGGWDACQSYPYNFSKPCLVYSFGINNEWSFDDAVSKGLGCTVHSYDPSMNSNDHVRPPSIHFHKTGLNNSDSINNRGWRMRTFSSILQENGHTGTVIDLLKIDIDYSEWLAFPEMITSGSLRNVRQFCFEIHVKLSHQPEPSSEMYIRGLTLLTNLYTEGFRIFNTHKNMDAKYISMFGMKRTGCHEIYMVRNTIGTFEAPSV